MTEKINKVIKLTYFDGKDVNIMLPEKEVPKFLECYLAKKPYWSPAQDSGFLTDVDKVRFVGIFNEPPPEEKKSEEIKPEQKVDLEKK